MSRTGDLLKSCLGRKVLVLGTGVTGRAVAKLLAQAGFQVVACDERKAAEPIKAELAASGVDVWGSFQSGEKGTEQLRLSGFGFAVYSPGISPRSAFGRTAINADIPVISELDLALPFVGMPDIAVTGTNGKTTTVNIIHQMLVGAGVDAGLVGNVGTPFVELIDSEKMAALQADYAHSRVFVAEVSSYQLETTEEFSPHIGIWLNLSDDHLERHGSMEEYLRVKARIFAQQNSVTDWAIINLDDPWSAKMCEFPRGRFFPIGELTAEREQEPTGAFYNADNQIVFRLEGAEERYNLAQCRLRGAHNKINLCSAVGAARIFGVGEASVQRTIDEFEPLGHRIEVVGTKGGVVYINDSKATNVHAVAAALDAMKSDYPGAPVILLLGGEMKEGSWRDIVVRLSGLVTSVICFGGDRDKVYEAVVSESQRLIAEKAIDWPFSVEKQDYLKDATERARAIAKPGEVILMSPACASFDAYTGYTVRGRHFREIVEGFAG